MAHQLQAAELAGRFAAAAPSPQWPSIWSEPVHLALMKHADDHAAVFQADRTRDGPKVYRSGTSWLAQHQQRVAVELQVSIGGRFACDNAVLTTVISSDVVDTRNRHGQRTRHQRDNSRLLHRVHGVSTVATASCDFKSSADIVSRLSATCPC